MKYENLNRMIEGWRALKLKIYKKIPDTAIERIIFDELFEFCALRVQQIDKTVSDSIECYNEGCGPDEPGTKYPTFAALLESQNESIKYWRNAWEKRINVHDHNRLLQDKLKTLSTEAADIISRLESELKEAQTAAEDYKKQYLKCFNKFLKLEEENAILRGDISENGLERY